MSKTKDLTGRIFGRLFVICRMGSTKDKKATWLCQCQCGNHKVAVGKILLRGESRSCGCLFKESRHWPHKGSRAIDLTGRIFGRWLVICRMVNEHQHPRWLVQCKCGEHRIVSSSSLISGQSQSCGCLARERSSERFSQPRTHGMTNSPEYRSWQAMKNRTTNPNYVNYHRYGGRGIVVCDRWLNDFMAFYEDMGPRPSPKHSIERLNNDGPYSKENCVWATMKEQTRNRRMNVFVTYKGETKCIADWAEYFGISRQRLSAMLRRGVATQEELSTLFGDTSANELSTPAQDEGS